MMFRAKTQGSAKLAKDFTSHKFLCENVIRDTFLILSCGETLSLQIEHSSVTSAEFHQLIVRAQLDYCAILEYTNAVCVSHSGESV